MKDLNIAIFAPTASGKTALSVELAGEIGAEIINMDSLQVYRELNIGTAKPKEEEKKNIPHHLFNCLNPDEKISAFEYKELANKIITDIKTRDSYPVLVGGTGLYLSSLYYDFEFRKNSDKSYREYSKESLQKILKEKDEALYNSIDINNTRRLIRAIESGENLNNEKKENTSFRIFYIDIDRALLRKRVEKRLDLMLKEGFIEETIFLRKKYGNVESLKSIGYKEIIEYLDNNYTYDEMREKIIINTMRYAKRQKTWAKNQYKKIYILPFEMSNSEKIAIIKREIYES